MAKAAIPAPPPPPSSDEGVEYEWLDHQSLVNLSSDQYDRHRRELRVNGRCFSHVADDARGRWIYREG